MLVYARDKSLIRFKRGLYKQDVILPGIKDPTICTGEGQGIRSIKTEEKKNDEREVILVE